MDNTEEKKFFSKIGLSYLIGAVVYYVMVSVLGAVLYKTYPSFMTGQGSMFMSFGTLFIIGYPLMYFLIKEVPVSEIPKKKLGFGMAIVSFFCAYFIMVVCNVIGLIINAQIGKITGKGLMNPIVGAMGELNIFAQVLIVVILAPIAEELVFRKMLVDRVYKYGELLAALTSGLMFGLFHGNFQQFVYAFGLGVFFAFIYIRTGKIIYTIIFHICINFLGTAVASLVMGEIDIQQVQQYMFSGQMDKYMEYVNEHMAAFAFLGLYGFVMLIVILIGFILTCVFARKFKFVKHDSDLTGSQAFVSLFANTGMILFIVWWIFNIVLAQFGTSFTNLIYKLFV